MTSCVRRPHAMDVFQPTDKSKDVKLPHNEGRTMTLCLGSNNKVLYYLGDIEKPIVGPTVTGYGKDSLPEAISEIALKMKSDTSKYLIVLIKASDKASYKNFERTLGIINSCKIKSYGVVEITPKETDLLKKQNAY